MSDEFADPLNDPRFPDRPNTADFWRLSEAVLRNDGDATEGGRSAEQIYSDEIADLRSVLYMAKARAAMMGLPAISGATLWLDAFAAGVRFQQAGGHRAG